MDRHKLWRRVRSDYEDLKTRAPEGFQPVVLVHLRGKSGPLELGFVRTLRDPEYPWVRFELTEGVRPGQPPRPVNADARWVYVREDDIEYVEMVLRERPPFDFFDYEVLEDEPDAE